MKILNRRIFNSLFNRNILLRREYWIFNRYLTSSDHRYDENRRKKLNLTSTKSRRLFEPIDVQPMIKSSIQSNIGEELTGGKTFDRNSLLRILTDFYRRDDVKRLSKEHGIDLRLFQDVYVSFRKYSIQSNILPVDLHIIFNDIINGSGHLTDLFPYFLRHAREMYPHLTCIEDLKKISDLRDPANWYPDARAIRRKIIFHAGPTNSGKTYHALQRFLNSPSGVYCGPLKLLASEVFYKMNSQGTKCDLITGEERRYADPDGNPANHVACTVEMTNLTTIYDVAIIDEIQMMRDPQRGWAWTRALLGVQAKEIHLCGEPSTIRLVEDLIVTTGDDLQINQYQRLTKLNYLDRSLESFDNVKPGDCFVCFSKSDIFYITKELEKRHHDVAVIYGSLPPGTKLLQAQRFNDPNDRCKILVSTDAIGMGLNLNIKRVIFYSLSKPQLNEQGEKEKDIISTSQALQIAGRAGRFASSFQDGEVTTFRKEDLSILKDILNRPVETIKRAGLHPTAEQIEMFAYHLPKHSLSNLIDIFVLLSQLDDSLFFMCHVEDMKFLSDLIEHVPLSLRARYTFSCAPINRKMPFVCTMFLKYARQYSRNESTTFEWVSKEIGWPFEIPQTILDLIHLEEVFDCLDLYLWLSFRFSEMFPDKELIRGIQTELDQIIHSGVQNIVKLIHRTNSFDQDKQISSSSLSSLNEQKNIDFIETIDDKSSRDDHRFDIEKSKSSLNTKSPNSSSKIVHSYLNALKSQAESRGFQFNSNEDLIEQLINKGFINRRSIDKLQKQINSKEKNNKFI